MVTLAYGPDVPASVLDLLEHHARTLGLPLHIMEQLGHDLERAEGFILAAEQGLGVAFAMNLTYGAPFDRLLEAASGTAGAHGDGPAALVDVRVLPRDGVRR